MATRIKHVAICTENYDRMAEFYKTIFGMKKITNGMTDATGNYNPERGHISDGLIGYALLQRQPGISAGLDHFGFEVEDLSSVLEKLAEKYPDVLVSKTLDYVPFAGSAHDPTGNQFDISQNQMTNVREGYKESKLGTAAQAEPHCHAGNQTGPSRQILSGRFRTGKSK